MWGGGRKMKLCSTIWISKLSKMETYVQAEAPGMSPGSWAVNGGRRGWDRRSKMAMAGIWQQVLSRRGTRWVTEYHWPRCSEPVSWTPWWRCPQYYCMISDKHVPGFMNLHLDGRELISELEGEDQHLLLHSTICPVLPAGYLEFDWHWTLVSA